MLRLSGMMQPVLPSAGDFTLACRQNQQVDLRSARLDPSRALGDEREVNAAAFSWGCMNPACRTTDQRADGP
jgi:hypothetical protein